VRGTDFIMVHDAGSQVTKVVGVSGLVDVNGSIDRERNGVVVGTREITEIEPGGHPTPPRKLDQTIFRQFLDGLEFIGFGIPESLLFENPVLAGDYVPPADRAESHPEIGAESDLPGGSSAGIPPWEKPDVSDSVGQPPGAVADGEIGIEF
jgi:hypothetical protein